jgi:DNA-binding MarR family transcriptional regulator
MQQLANAVVLSQSATTRLVTRLEKRDLLSRYLCEEDRRGIYTEVTAEGDRLLALARPTHDEALNDALTAATEIPELAPLVSTLRDVRATA